MRTKTTHGHGQVSGMPRLLGDRLCLDFVNSIDGPRSPHPHDFVPDYAALIQWSRHVGLVADADAQRLLSAAIADPGAADHVFQRAMRLRSAIHEVFLAVASGREPGSVSLEIVSAEHRIAMFRGRLVRAEGGASWRWTTDDDGDGPVALDRLLWEVSRSAVDVLTGDDLRRVRECPGADDCGWLFYDTSRNGSRRWCSMEGCGSRVKMRHHYARHRLAP